MTYKNLPAEFVSGIDEIDEQHDYFFGLVKETKESVSKGASASEISNIIKQMEQYARKHFDTEERYFAEWNYPDAEAHAREHIKLIEQVSSFYDSSVFSIPKANELLEFLNFWLEDHLKKKDLKYIQFYKKREAAKNKPSLFSGIKNVFSKK